MNAVDVTIIENTASQAVAQLRSRSALARCQRVVGTACTLLTKNYLRALPPNSRGWPSTGFWSAAAQGTTWDRTATGVEIKIENEDIPGAMRQRFYGGTVSMKDHLLTIPARPEFNGIRASSFTNLKFVMFKSGAKALVIGAGGVGQVNFQTGKEKLHVRGAGARSQGLVAYWLVESVDQEANPNCIPSAEDYVEVSREALKAMLRGAE